VRIFATVGTQLPFDRLIQALDDWARDHCGEEVFAQVGRCSYIPKHIQFCASLDLSEFKQKLEQCELVVSHAGMGTILTALDLNKRVVVMPRSAVLGEHRNEHQQATARHLVHLANLSVVHDGDELAACLGDSSVGPPASRVKTNSGDGLISAIRQFAGLKS
jgi:UDP-N-acetylglucosamine transferase subunit ALG13